MHQARQLRHPNYVLRFDTLEQGADKNPRHSLVAGASMFALKFLRFTIYDVVNFPGCPPFACRRVTQRHNISFNVSFAGAWMLFELADTQLKMPRADRTRAGTNLTVKLRQGILSMIIDLCKLNCCAEAGMQLSSWRAVLIGLRGDWSFFREFLGLERRYNGDAMCHLCGAMRFTGPPGMRFTNIEECAAHRSTSCA